MEGVLDILTLQLPFSTESVKNGILNEPKLIFIWCLIFSFIIATVVILFRALHHRSEKNKVIVRRKLLNERFYNYLSELASGNYEDKALELMAADKETTLALTKEDINQTFHRSTLLKELLSLHRNLAGESAYKLREVYLTLGFKEESLKKLKNRSWRKRIQGIQELKQMDIKDGYTPLFELINDKNRVVRLEAILARMKMDTDPLSLFNQLQEELTDWEQLRIHNLLRRFPLEEMPSFIPYLHHPLDSVQQFSIKMVAVFNQVAAESILLEKLGAEGNTLNICIVESLAVIGSENSVKHIHQHFDAASSKLKVTMIKTLLSISGEEELAFFAHQLDIDSYDVQLASAKALVRLGEKGGEALEENLITAERNTEKQNMIDHAKQWTNR